MDYKRIINLWRSLGLDRQQDRTLNVLLAALYAAREKNFVSRDMAAELGVTPAGITLIVNRMEKRGLLVRDHRSSKDRREIPIRATKKLINSVAQFRSKKYEIVPYDK